MTKQIVPIFQLLTTTVFTLVSIQNYFILQDQTKILKEAVIHSSQLIIDQQTAFNKSIEISDLALKMKEAAIVTQTAQSSHSSIIYYVIGVGVALGILFYFNSGGSLPPPPSSFIDDNNKLNSKMFESLTELSSQNKDIIEKLDVVIELVEEPIQEAAKKVILTWDFSSS